MAEKSTASSALPRFHAPVSRIPSVDPAPNLSAVITYVNHEDCCRHRNRMHTPQFSTKKRVSQRMRKPTTKCVLGVCAARKKTSSDAMAQILDRLRAYGDFQIEIWGEEIVQGKFIVVHSTLPSLGVSTQDIFNNRMMLYEVLEKYGIPTFRHIYADRRDGRKVEVKEMDDYIELDGKRMRKPLVEKPFEGNDHNIYIYYSKAQGGGCRKLFRKVKNKSSEFFAGLNSIRKEGNYCYEEFITGVKDLKVYTIGPNYAHGEVRKSPAVDGIVARNPDGKEMRLLTLLTSEERDIARRIVHVFQQNICGFDVIRTNGRAYVIDVNGWSFVKGNMRYYDKCARTIRKLCLGAISPAIATGSVKRPIGKERKRVLIDGDNKHILLSLVTVFRHGDRTPKRKLKLKAIHDDGNPLFELLSPLLSTLATQHQMKHPEMLWMFKHTKQEIKLKKRKQILPFLKALDQLIKRLEVSSCKEDIDLRTNASVVSLFCQMQWTRIRVISVNDSGVLLENKVLEKHFSPQSQVSQLRIVWGVIIEDRQGLKIQLKPKKIVEGRVVECLLACKWGGALTRMGLDQAKFYAPVFWSEMLRPPSTQSAIIQQAEEFTRYKKERSEFLQGMQVYAAAESRVRSSAKAFIRETLQNEDIPPGTLHCDNKVQEFLDDVSKANSYMDIAKKQVKHIVTAEKVLVDSDPRYRPSATVESIPSSVKSKEKKKKDDGYFKDSSRKAKSKKNKLNSLITKDLRGLIDVLKAENIPFYRMNKSDEYVKGMRVAGKKCSIKTEKRRGGAHDLTEWELRCLRWLKVPEKELKNLYNQLSSNTQQVGLNKQIRNHVEESRRKLRTPKRTPILQPLGGNCEGESRHPAEGSTSPVVYSRPSQVNVNSKRTSEDNDTESKADCKESSRSPDSQKSSTDSVKLKEGGVAKDESSKKKVGRPFPPSNWALVQFRVSFYYLGNRRFMDMRLAIDAQCIPVFPSRLLNPKFERNGYFYRRFKAESAEASSRKNKPPSEDVPLRPILVEETSEKSQPSGYEDFDLGIVIYGALSVLGRWLGLLKDFYDPKKDVFNTTKIPDIYDNIKYDSLHNRHLLRGLRSIYISAKNVADFVIPQEYGLFQTEKLVIGRSIVQNLLQHILQNLLKVLNSSKVVIFLVRMGNFHCFGVSPFLRKALYELSPIGMELDPSHRANLYFSSESHLHSLRNAILLSDIPHNRTVATTLEAMEINYMIKMRVKLSSPFKLLVRIPHFLTAVTEFLLSVVAAAAAYDPVGFLTPRHYVDVQFAPGAALDPFIFMGKDHLLPVSRPIPVNGRIPLEVFKQFVEGRV
eukprot:jgi/Bigna1/76430/fgenesh1_pg.41_\